MKCDLCDNVARHCCRRVEDGKLNESKVCTVCAGKMWTEEKSIHPTLSFIPLMRVPNETAGQVSSTG